MNERQLLAEILVRAERTERRVRNIQFRGIRMETTIMSALDDLKASVAKFVADVEVYKTNVKQAIADAIAKDEAGQDVSLAELKATVDAADAGLAPPDVPAA